MQITYNELIDHVKTSNVIEFLENHPFNEDDFDNNEFITWFNGIDGSVRSVCVDYGGFTIINFIIDGWISFSTIKGLNVLNYKNTPETFTNKDVVYYFLQLLMSNIT